MIDGDAPESGDSPVLEFTQVSKTFLMDKGVLPAVRDIDLRVRRGRFVCIVGPSGCGKSTLLNMAAGLMRPTSGTVSYEGAPVSGVHPGIGYITQNDNLLPWRRVAENVDLSLRIQRVGRTERRARVAEALAAVGLTDFARSYPAQLSGGMRKRVTLARTWVYDPATILMDEPFGALDAQMRLAMHQELTGMWERDTKTVLFVTHDIEEAVLLGDEVVVFGARPGTIIDRLPVPLARPRELEEVRTSPDFVDLCKVIREKVMAQQNVHTN